MVLVLDKVAEDVDHHDSVLVRVATGLHELALGHSLEEGHQTLGGLGCHGLDVLCSRIVFLSGERHLGRGDSAGENKSFVVFVFPSRRTGDMFSMMLNRLGYSTRMR